MKNFFVTYTLPDKASRDGFLKAIQDNKCDEMSKAEDGCHKYDYFLPADDDCVLLLWEQWETLDHQKAHTKMPHFAKIGQLKEQFGATATIEILE